MKDTKRGNGKMMGAGEKIPGCYVLGPEIRALFPHPSIL